MSYTPAGSRIQDDKRDAIIKVAKSCLSAGTPMRIGRFAERCGCGNEKIRKVLREAGLLAAIETDKNA